jgi:hypothetical protein
MVCNMGSMVCNMGSVVCNMGSVVCNMGSVVYVYDLWFVIYFIIKGTYYQFFKNV